MDQNNEERQLEAEEPPLEGPFIPVSAGAFEQATTEERRAPALTPEKALEIAIYTCNHCQEYVRGGVITICGHLFCWTCLWPHLANKPSPECPRCQTQLNLNLDIVTFKSQGPNARRGDGHAVAEPGAMPRPSGIHFAEHTDIFLPNAEDLAIFNCNHCKDLVLGGVITFCGHLYCWTCLWPQLADNLYPKCPRCQTPLDVQEEIFPFNARPGEEPVLAEPGAVPRPLGIGFAGNVDQTEVLNRYAEIAMRIESTYIQWLKVICAILMIFVYGLISMT